MSTTIYVDKPIPANVQPGEVVVKTADGSWRVSKESDEMTRSCVEYTLRRHDANWDGTKILSTLAGGVGGIVGTLSLGEAGMIPAALTASGAASLATVAGGAILVGAAAFYAAKAITDKLNDDGKTLAQRTADSADLCVAEVAGKLAERRKAAQPLDDAIQAARARATPGG